MTKEPETGRLQGAKVEPCDGKKCIHNLVNLAKSDFEKAAVIEFINMDAKVKEDFARIKTELKWVKWLIISLFSAIILIKLIGG